MKATHRIQVRTARVAELRALIELHPELQVIEFLADRHLRVIGERSVDYWPGTGSARPSNQYGLRTKFKTPVQIVEYCLGDSVHVESTPLDVEFRLVMETS